MRKLITAAAFITLSVPVHAQELAQACVAPGEAAGGAAVERQPRIVVVPYTKAGEDIRTVLDEDINRRIAVLKIQEAFDRRGFSAGDFIGMIRSLPRRENPMSQTDVLAQIFERSRAEIYVEVEINIEETGNLHSAVALMRGYLTANGLALGNGIGRSPRQQLATETSRLVENATGAANVDPILDLMQEKFDEYVENGVPITVDISMRQGAQIGPYSEIPGQDATLAEVIEDWLSVNAWKSIYNISMLTETQMALDEVRMPLLDPETCRNNSPLRFARGLIDHLRTLEVRATPALSGGTLLIELR